MAVWLRGCSEIISKWLLRKASVIGAVVAGSIIVAMATLTVAAIVVREIHLRIWFFSGYFEMMLLLMALLAVLALAYCWYSGRHIRIGVIYERSRSRVRALLDALPASIGLVWISLVAWSLAKQSNTALEFGSRTEALKIPIAPFKITLAIAMAHFALVLLWSLIGYLQQLWKEER